MRNRTSILQICLFLATGIVFFIVEMQPTGTPVQAYSSIRPRLFEYLGKSTLAEARRAIQVNLEVLESPFLRDVELETPDGRRFSVTRSDFENRAAQNYTWRGKTTASTGSRHDVTITVLNGSVSGLIYTETGVFQIIPQAGNRQILEKIEPASFAPCGGSPLPPAPKATEPGQSGWRTSGPEADDGSVIDIMVLYTAAARIGAGGTAQIQATAQSAVDVTNTAYGNSNITTRLRLVYTGELDFAETGTANDMLVSFWGNSTAQTLRNQYGADVMALLVEILPNACGIGYVMTSVSSTFERNAYSLTDRGCAVGNLSFGHEVGHNQGCQHDPANGSGGAFPYSYGHFVNGQFRTVMSYDNQCTQGCNRVAHFSNPNIAYNGQLTGINGTRDNALSLNNAALTISNFRASLAPTVPTITRFVPLAAFPGKTITVSGTNFSAGQTQVFFGGLRLIPAAGVTVVNSTTLNVVVPNSGSGTVNINGFLTVRVNGTDAVSSNLADGAAIPCDGTATFPEFVLWGDSTGDGLSANANDVSLSRAFSQFQATPTTRQRLATDVVPVNGTCRGDGAITATDISFLRAVSFGQATF